MYDIIEEDYNIYSFDMFEGDDEIQAYERLFSGNNVRIQLKQNNRTKFVSIPGINDNAEKVFTSKAKAREYSHR